MLAKIRGTFTTAFHRFSMLPFLFLLILINLFFFINGRSFFPNWDATYGQLIMVYLIMALVFVLWAGRRTESQLKKPLKTSIFGFTVCFIATYIVLLLLSATGLIKTYLLPQELLWQTVIIQICVVATAEELMFRGVLLDIFGVVLSSALFAVWHSYAYQVVFYEFSWETFNWPALLFAFIMGIIFALIAKRKELGLAGSIGAHAAYNLVVVGAFVTFNMM